MSLRNFFNHRVRGVRAVELWAGGLAVVLVLGVYLAKTNAGDQGADIAKTQREIGDEERKIRLLRAEVAYLEQPGRLEKLSNAYLHLQPLSGARDVSLANLADIAASRGASGGVKSNVPNLTTDAAEARAAQMAALNAAVPPAPGQTAAPAGSDAPAPEPILAMAATGGAPR